MTSQTKTTRNLIGAAAALAVGFAGSLLAMSPAHAAYDDQSIEGTVSVTGLVGSLAGGIVIAEFIGTPTDPDSTGASAVIQSDGSYHLGLYEPGSYRVCVESNAARNWSGACANDGATIVVGTGQTVTGANITATQLGGLGGQLRFGTPGSNSTSAHAVARLWHNTGSGYDYIGESLTGGIEGYYAFGALEPGDYAVEFVDIGGQHSSEYWNDSRYWSGRTEVTVTAGPTQQIGLTLLAPRTYDRERLAGPDRFSTAVAISEAQWDDGDDVPVIYIASGLNYPDALSAGPAAIAGGGGMLLVLPDGIPAVVADELDRIDPQRIVVVGGTGAISASVEVALRSYVDDPELVVRIGGADRYATSRLLVLDAFDGVDDLFVATGYNFPDALAATPAAGFRGAPLLLVPGTANAIDTTTRNTISSLGPQDVHIVGGPGAVSDALAQSIYDTVPSVQAVYRYAGSNRYETAVVLNIYTFPSSDYAFIASGNGFADALAGGPLAGYLGAPMYLSTPDCVPQYVLQDIEQVGANGVVLLGGTGVLSANVLNMVSCGVPAAGIPQTVSSLERELSVGRE